MAYQKEPQEFRILSGKNLYFKEHFHPQTEIVLCTEGQIELTVEEKSYVVECGDCAVVFPNQPHSYRRCHGDFQSDAYLAIIPIHYVEDFEAELDTTFPIHPIIRRQELPPNFEKMMEALYVAGEEEGTNIRLYKAFSNLILAYLMPKLSLKSAAKSYDLALTPRILNYLAANQKESLPLAQVARTFGISRNTLSQIFSKELHTTYLEYITSLRLDTAEKLLRKTNLAVSVVAAESGFQSERSFYRVFKERKNCSPAQYRQQYKSAKK